MPTERIRLLVFVTIFDVGGTERQIVSFAEGLDRSLFDLRVACFQRAGSFLKLLEAQRVPVTEYPIRSLHGAATLRQLIRFARDLRRDRIQVVHAFGFYPNVFALPAARLARVPVVIASLRDMGDVWTARQRRVQRWACRMADQVVANAEAVRRAAELERYDPGRLRVIRNGLDLTRFSGRTDAALERRALGLPAGAPVVAVFARLNHPVKGIDWFLKAAARLAPAHPDVRFLVVGEGPMRGDLERLAEQLGLGRRVLFTGLRLDVPRTMAAVSISVLPSLSEGLSNVLIESMAAGLPVVATRVGGTPEVVQDERTGLLVPARDPRALAEAIGSLLRDPRRAEALGRAGRLAAEARFSLDRMVRETQTLYRDLLQQAVMQVNRPLHGELPPDREGRASEPTA